MSTMIGSFWSKTNAIG